MLERLLQWSSRAFKTDMRYLLSGGFWLTAGQVAASGSAFLLAIAFANLFPKEEYGVYKYVLSLASILWTLSLSGLGTSIVRSIANGFEGTLRSGFRDSMRWGLLTLACSLAASAYYFINGNMTLGTSLFIVAAFSPLLNSSSLYAAYLTGRKDFKTATLAWSLTTIVSSAATAVALLFTDKVVPLVLVYFVSNTVCAIALYSWVMRKYTPNDRVDPEALGYGKHLSVMNVIDAIAQQIDKVLIFQLLGGAQLAVYSFALALPEQMKGVMKSIARLAFPKYSSRSLEDLKKNVPKKSILFAAGILPVIGLYVIAAPYIYQIFFPEYLESVFYSQVLAVTILTVVATLPSTALQSQLAKRELYINSVGSNSFQIVANVILIYLYGLPGIVAARVISRLFAMVLPFILLRTSQSTHPQEASGGA